MKKHTKKIIVAIAVIAVLAITFWWGGNAPGLRGWKFRDAEEEASQKKVYRYATSEKKFNKSDENAADESGGDVVEDKTEADEANNSSEENTISDNASKTENAAASKEEADNVEQSSPRVNEKKNSNTFDSGKVEDEENYCTISVNCEAIFKNIEYFDKNKIDLLPSNGMILAETKAVFNEGENVFNVLQRELKRAKIHLEFTNTPIFDSVYIEGINNIYEFDCGENSGWMYSVNGIFPNYGCSKYVLQKGDVIEWVYTCDLGRDVGGYYANAE